jgi:hypothetical protein
MKRALLLVAASVAMGLGIAACTSEDDTLLFGISDAEHDELFFPMGENNAAALNIQGACPDDKPCNALTGSHQCSSLDVNNQFARPFCQPDDPFQVTQPKLQGSYACAQCHGESGSFKVMRCAECHLVLPIVPPGNPNDLDGAKSPDDRHRHVGGFAVDSQICASCHAENFDTDRNGSFDRNDLSVGNGDRVVGHLPFDIDVDTPHYRMPCAECHTQNRLDKVWALDFNAPETCDRCHANADMDTLHTGVRQQVGNAAVAFSRDACLTCHLDGRTRFDDILPDP